MADPQKLLIPSNAGMRLIAQTTLLNKGDFTRLREYLEQNYTPIALEVAPVAARLAELKAIYRMAGKLRIGQVIAVNKHAVLVVLESQKGNFYSTQVVVEEDYPHKVLQYVHQQADEILNEAEDDSDDNPTG